MKIVVEDLKLKPTRAYPGDAGADLMSAEDYVIVQSNTVQKVSTGVKIAIPYGKVGLIFSRSGQSNLRVSLANRVGVIDHRYRGTIYLNIEALGLPYIINKYDRIAQLVITDCYTGDFEIVDSLDETDRGENGFGSTGI